MTTPKPPAIQLKLKSVLLVQSTVAVVLTGAVALIWNVQLSASFGLGIVIIAANLLLMVWAWSRILDKKPFALTSGIIVVKYTVLLGAIFYLSREAWFDAMGAGLGMAAFIMSALVQAGLAKWE